MAMIRRGAFGAEGAKPPGSSQQDMRRSPKDWRLVALGTAFALVLGGGALLSRSMRGEAGDLLGGVATDILSALETGDPHALAHARERVRRSAHRDMLLRSAPGLLRLMDALEATSARCDPKPMAPYGRGVCHLRHLQLDQALLAFARAGGARGGDLARELVVRLMAMRRARLGAVGRLPGLGSVYQ